MTNSEYLVVSYFVCAALSIAVGTLVFLLLQRPFVDVVEAASRTHLSSVLKRLFPVGLLLPALLGFSSVSYQSCDRTTYESIVKSRSYLVERNQEQISSILLYIVVAVLAWDVVIFFVLKLVQNARNKAS